MHKQQSIGLKEGGANLSTTKSCGTELTAGADRAPAITCCDQSYLICTASK